MKKLIAALLLLNITITYSQSIELDHPDLIEPLLTEFRYEARKRGLFIDGHIAKNLGGVQVVTEEEIEKLYRPKKDEKCNCLAIMGYKTLKDLYNYHYYIPYIYLRDKVIDYPQGLRVVLFHELGHLYGMEHSTGIMSLGLSVKQRYTEKEWKAYLDTFFEELQQADLKKRKRRNDNTFH